MGTTNSVTIATEETGRDAPEQTNEQTQPQTFEQLQASYAELRADHTRKSQELADLKRGTTPPTEEQQQQTPADQKPDDQQQKPDDKKPDDKSPDEAAKEVADKAGFDLTSYSTEYETTGDVSQENRAKIAEGLKNVLGADAQSIVNQYIDGQKAVHANQRSDFFNAAGGEDNYNSMLEFARATMSESEKAKYNAHINGGDHDVRMMALESLRSRYEAANGRIPTQLKGKGGSFQGGVRPFANSAQMVAAMSDPKYSTDAEYRNEVAARIRVSPNL